MQQLTNILAALDMAHTDGVDVVSLSLRIITDQRSRDPFSTMTSGLVAEGLAVIAAAGNDGSLGTFNPSAPGTGPEVIAVGSVDNTVFPVVYNAIDSQGFQFNYASVWPFSSPTGRICSLRHRKWFRTARGAVGRGQPGSSQ